MIIKPALAVMLASGVAVPEKPNLILPKPAIVKANNLEFSKHMLLGMPLTMGMLYPAKKLAQIEYITTVEDAGNLSTYTFTNASIGTATSDRLVVVVVTCADTGGSTSTLSSVTIGGSAATIHVSSGTSEFITAVASRLVSSGTTATVVLNFANALGRGACQIYRVWNYNNATPNATATVGGTTNASSRAVTVDIPATGGVAVYGAMCDGSRAVTWTNATKDMEDQAFGTENQTRSTASRTASGADSTSVTASWGTSVLSSMSAASWG